MTDLRKICEEICGNYYQIYFEEPRREICIFIYGELQNFTTNGNVVIYNSKGLYVFPYNSIMSMIPAPTPDKLSEREKELYGLR